LEDNNIENNESSLEIPANVINIPAYKELIRREAELKANPDRFYHAKTADVTIDLLSGYRGILKQIKSNKIAEYEADIIERKAKEFTGARSRLINIVGMLLKEIGP
jgi:hypothetical protein